MMPIKTVVTHYFEKEREPAWPDLPWPEWKPETKKMMRPLKVVFTITSEEGVLRVSDPHVYGQRILASGALGTTADSTYFKNHIPPFIEHLLEEAKRYVMYPAVGSVPGTVYNLPS